MNTQTTDNSGDGGVRKALIFVGGTLLLLATWYILYIWVAAMTEGWLVPWDTVPGRPPVGDWQRTVNDFFETRPGAVLPAAIVIGISALLFLIRVVRERNKTFLPLGFAATNLLFSIADTILVIPVHRLPDLWLPKPRPVLDVGYHRTWPAIAVTTILLLVLFWAQWTGWPLKGKRAENTRLALLTGSLPLVVLLLGMCSLIKMR
ncbi:MAG: hypothetical protein KAX26_08830 [Anaerolineae bacterium]|nr:hypothetical protein [Anaerolineae bacterium]